MNFDFLHPVMMIKYISTIILKLISVLQLKFRFSGESGR